MKTIKIAIDGPAGAGKSTISKAVAKELGFVYIDTGAMYRTVALKAIRSGIDTKNEPQKVIDLLDGVNIDIKYENSEQHVFLDGEDVTSLIRTKEVSIGASDVAVIPEVRIKLVKIQRDLANRYNCIMDGRDIGTYVLPDADVKIFLSASVEERARRRYEEMLKKGIECSFDEVKKDIAYRDKNDSSRVFAPLRAADDAVLVDTSGNQFEESMQMILKIIKEKLG